MDAPILLPPPESVLTAFLQLLKTPEFLISLGWTAFRAAAGFTLALTLAVLTGVPSGLNPVFRGSMQPVVILLRTVPVLAVILLAVLWFAPGRVPVFVTFLMGFPILWQAVTDGISSRDRNLREVCETYRIPAADRLTGFILPAMVPSLLTAVRSTVGLSWKVVVAAEILSQPAAALGAGMYTAQLRLETAEMMAWTAAAVLAGGGTELLTGTVTRRLERRFTPQGGEV